MLGRHLAAAQDLLPAGPGLAVVKAMAGSMGRVWQLCWRASIVPMSSKGCCRVSAPPLGVRIAAAFSESAGARGQELDGNHPRQAAPPARRAPEVLPWRLRLRRSD